MTDTSIKGAVDILCNGVLCNLNEVEKIIIVGVKIIVNVTMLAGLAECNIHRCFWGYLNNKECGGVSK